jgi:hypothetical protein
VSFDVREHGLEGTPYSKCVQSVRLTKKPLSGPVEVTFPRLLSGIEKPFAEAIQTLGISVSTDPARAFVHTHKGEHSPLHCNSSQET